MVVTFNSPSINAYYNTLRVHRKSIACFLYFVEWRSFHSSNLKTFAVGGVKVPGWALSVDIPSVGSAQCAWAWEGLIVVTLFPRWCTSTVSWGPECSLYADSCCSSSGTCVLAQESTGELVAGNVCPALPSPPAGLFAWHKFLWGLTMWI